MNMKFKKDYKRLTGREAKISLFNIADFMVRPHVRYVWWWRRYERGHGKFAKLVLFQLGKKYGLEISTLATIGEGLYLGHPYNITVGGGAVLGKYVSLHKNCVIGRENRGKREGIPTLGDKVWVGIGAVVVGNITIGDDVMICPGSFVNFDVPSHSVVVGNPGVVHRRENATQGYI